jgi:large subunit ribosomal protein L18
VFRSNRQITVQLIDDGKQRTLAAATGQVQEVASSIVKQAAKHKIKQIVYDRGGYRYHGQVKALAETIRKGGLKF